MNSSNKKILKTRRFSKDIRKLEKRIQKEAFEISKILSNNPFDEQLNIKPLFGYEKIYRAAVFKDYRLIYAFDNENLYLLRIAHRKEIYRNLEI